ncbi:hypothetical protein, variant [Microbotryum lychnidis-dioicae p1A1 Lamole]|uniref:Uncharacterized protein n=1 Tax=Microbotryum lychnidis-dioicae (strain p1A1 Lamole / MvSl-1064) TaxID=683840 RepID=U5GYX7_USTV1|nr:hypothetical protein, variant [Microbotryum lychnidis-dioicae p1A1 Lamole]|eukprot:KDE09486.1 hypothetical protein, variant [Microbotryum lychnidis-dioicae p1A1 Lamole]
MSRPFRVCLHRFRPLQLNCRKLMVSVALSRRVRRAVAYDLRHRIAHNFHSGTMMAIPRPFRRPMSACYTNAFPSTDYAFFRIPLPSILHSLVLTQLQILTASQRLAITFRPPRGSSERDDPGDSPSITPRPSASPPATTSQVASLRLQELARSLQVQAATERERVAEQLRTSTATFVGWVGTTSFSTGPPGSPLVVRQRYSRGRNNESTVDYAPEEDESGSSQDEDDDEEDHGLDGDVITFADGNVPSEEVLRMWYDTRRLVMGHVDADGVKQTKRTWHRGTLEGR